MNELKNPIGRIKNRKSPSIEGVHAEMVKGYDEFRLTWLLCKICGKGPCTRGLGGGV